MPIVPRYNLTQTSTHVHIEVSIPHVRVSTSTLDLVIVDGTELHLYAPPTYLLKLSFPDRVVSEDDVEDSLARAATTSTTSSVISVIEEAEEACIDNEEDTCSTSLPLKETIQHVWTKEDLPKLQYNPEKNHGTLSVIIRKENEGIWQDLDLLGRLQQPTKRQQAKKHVPAAAKSNNPLIKVTDTDDDNEKDKIENSISENVTTTTKLEDLLSINQKRPTYGLFQHYSNVIRDYAREGLAHEMLECPNPDEVYDQSPSANDSNDDNNNYMTEQQNRREIRIEMENEKFDTDRYLNDLCVEEEGDMIFDAAMQMIPHWMKDADMKQSSNNELINNVTSQFSILSTSDGNHHNLSFFTAQESHLLATLPSQSNIIPIQLTDEQKQSAFLSLTDILFAYVYDHRTTDGDPTVESSWTIMILSPSFSWLENYNPPYDTIADVIRWSIRRSLIYPYLRNYTLATKIVADVNRIIKGGRRTIIRCLLQLHEIMEKSESHYLFNKLYIDPLLGWIQQLEEVVVQKFGKELEDVIGSNVLGKDTVGLGLVELESLLYDDESTSSSSEEDYASSDDSGGYESDAGSRGIEDTTVSTSADEEEVSVNINHQHN